MQNIKSERQFGDRTFTQPKLNVLEARRLQLEITKTLGAPFMQMMGGAVDENQSDEEADQSMIEAFSNALVSISTDETIKLLTKLTETTFNTSKQRRTKYELDFDADTTDDLEVALWVIEEQFSSFFGALKNGRLTAQIGQVMEKVNGE